MRSGHRQKSLVVTPFKSTQLTKMFGRGECLVGTVSENKSVLASGIGEGRGGDRRGDDRIG